MADAKAGFKADFAKAGSAKAFLKTYCDIDMDNLRDTGSATGSKSWVGEEADKEEVVLEGLSTRFWWYPSAQQTTIEGLTVDWGDYPQPDLSHAGFRFQVGTKANQNILAAFSDIHANALGLRSDEGNLFSVQTRADAKRALTIFDRALRKSLDQATTIGSLVSRLSYTSSNDGLRKRPGLRIHHPRRRHGERNDGIHEVERPRPVRPVHARPGKSERQQRAEPAAVMTETCDL